MQERSLSDEKYQSLEGRINLTGIQALVRLQFDILRLFEALFPDKKIATFISGYEGSPLAGFDKTLQGILPYPFLRKNNIIHVMGGNEEAAATMAWGAQLFKELGPSDWDGVVSVWYGKGPGVRRAADAEDHMQMSGIGSKYGAGYFISGDDHTAKSSTTPHQTELIHYANHVPTFYPGSVPEILELGKLMAMISNITGLWMNLKIETFIADGSGSVNLNKESDHELKKLYDEFVAGHSDFRRYFNPILLRPKNIESEHELYSSKLPLVSELADFLNVDKWFNKKLGAKLGIIAPGQNYYNLKEALYYLGILHNEIEVYKPGMIWPVSKEKLKDFLRNKDEVIIIEQKMAFYEMFLKQLLYNDEARPRIYGKEDENGKALFPEAMSIPPEMIMEKLAPRLAKYEMFRQRNLEQRASEKLKKNLPLNVYPVPLPQFCTGCPHPTAADLPGYDDVRNIAEGVDGSYVDLNIEPKNAKHLAWGGIGCSTMLVNEKVHSNRIGHATQMGGEGLALLAALAFSNREFAYQVCGDGTFFHSARLNIAFIRDAIRSLKSYGLNKNLIFEVINNHAVAMTGGQDAIGRVNAEDVIGNILHEGIPAKNIAIVAEEEDAFKFIKDLYPGVKVHHRSEIAEVKERLALQDGLSFIWYDQKCAIEKGRERKKDASKAPKIRIFVNPEVCEDCGDCGVQGKCSSIQKLDTEFGEKVKVRQYDCKIDMSCLKGECPSYVKVYTRTGDSLRKPNLENILAGSLVDPERKLSGNMVFNLVAVSTGGEGLVTAYEILAEAAKSEGLYYKKEDDTGLSQKGGLVRASMRLSQKEIKGAFKIGPKDADLYVASDILGAANPLDLDVADSEKTKAIVNTNKRLTRAMITGKEAYPMLEDLIEQINSCTKKQDNIYVNATEIIIHYLNDVIQANLFLLGVAFESVENFPIKHAKSIEDAIHRNGGSRLELDKNISAFRYGRLYVQDPQKVMAFKLKDVNSEERRVSFATKFQLKHDAHSYLKLARNVSIDEAFDRKFARLVYELICFQDMHYAQAFVDFIEKVHDAEMHHEKNNGKRLTSVVAENLYGLMAYKDEYRVADLLTRPEETERIKQALGDNEVQKIRYLLKPPAIYNNPLIKKIVHCMPFVKFSEEGDKVEVGPLLLRAVKNMKFMRKVPTLNYFFGSGFSSIRQHEANAIAQYKQRVEDVLAVLDNKGYHGSIYGMACDALSYPSYIKGFEHVKQRNMPIAERLWEENINMMRQ